MSARTSVETVESLTRDMLACRRPRTWQRVHRHSYHAGEREQRQWQQHNRLDKDDIRARLTAAEHMERCTRPKGKRNGALGFIGLEVLKFLLKRRSKTTGQLDPSYEYIAEQIHRSRSAVCAAMKRLKALGFLEWIRRTRPVEDPEPDGQYVEQISNAYVLRLTGAAAELVRRILRRPTEAQRRDQVNRQREAVRAADATRAPDEILAEVSDPALRALLERLKPLVEGANPSARLNGGIEG